MALAQADTVKLEEFLGFPFLTWLRDLPLPSLHQLSRFLLTEKLVNWAMLRTVTNLLDISPEFRSLLSLMKLHKDRFHGLYPAMFPGPLQREFFSAPSMRNSSEELCHWQMALIFLHNLHIPDRILRCQTSS